MTNHLIDKIYTMDPMKRVKTVLDWCIRRGLYAILSKHHDFCGKKDELIKYGEVNYSLIKDDEESEKFIYNVKGKSLKLLIIDMNTIYFLKVLMNQE